MSATHATQPARDERSKVEAAEDANGSELVVTSDDPSAATRLEGLGVLGLKASQDHRREHHMMMARGEPAHAHQGGALAGAPYPV